LGWAAGPDDIESDIPLQAVSPRAALSASQTKATKRIIPILPDEPADACSDVAMPSIFRASDPGAITGRRADHASTE
jgi:hypothetical protein